MSRNGRVFLACVQTLPTFSTPHAAQLASPPPGFCAAPSGCPFWGAACMPKAPSSALSSGSWSLGSEILGHLGSWFRDPGSSWFLVSGFRVRAWFLVFGSWTTNLINAFLVLWPKITLVPGSRIQDCLGFLVPQSWIVVVLGSVTAAEPELGADIIIRAMHA